MIKNWLDHTIFFLFCQEFYLGDSIIGAKVDFVVSVGGGLTEDVIQKNL